MAVDYLFPNGTKAPTQAQMNKKYHGVHVHVSFADADVAPLDVVHNLQLELEAVPPLMPEVPIVVANPIAGGPKAALWTVANKDGNTVTFSRVASGPDTALTLDVWIYRHHPIASGIFG